MGRFKPTEEWVRRTFVPVFVFMAMVSDHGYLADFWHHLARGRAMAQSARLVDEDQFTYTVFGESFQDVNWLSQLIYYGLYQVGELALVRVVNALILAGTLALLIEICRRRSGSLFWAALVGAGVFVGIWHVLTIRPQTFSLLLFVLLLDILERADRRPGLLFLPPMILALWTNLHGAFPAGLMLIGCFFLAAAIQKRPSARPLFLRGAASSLATLINPYGWDIYLYVGQTSRRASARRIDEWLPPTWDLWIGKAFFISLAVLALCWLAHYLWASAKRSDHRCPLTVRDGLLLTCFLVLACTSARMVAWWLLILAPPIAQMLADLMPKPKTAQDSVPSLGAGLTFAGLMLIAVLSLPGLQRYQPLLVLRQQPRVEEDLDAVQAQLRSQLSGGRVFSRFEWGEYLSWSYSPEFAVFMDGRIEIFPDSVWNQYADITCGAGNWEKLLNDYQVDALLLDSEYHARTGLLAQVDRSPYWHKQFSARTALLYVRCHEH